MFEKAKEKVKYIWNNYNEEILYGAFCFAAGSLCMITGYAIGNAKNPKIEIKYICDPDGHLLSGSVVNLTKMPMNVKITNDCPGSNLPTFQEQTINPGIEYGGITESGARSIDLI